MNKFLLSILPDILLIIGFISLFYGVFEIYKPASFIVAGILLIAAFFPGANKNVVPTNRQTKKKS